MNKIKILQISNIFIKILDCYNWDWHFLGIDSHSFHRSFLLAMTNAASSVYGITSVVCSGICRRWGLVNRNTLQELSIRGCTGLWFEVQCPNSSTYSYCLQLSCFTPSMTEKKPLESWDTLTSPKLFHWGVKGDHYNEKIGQFSLWHHNSVLWWKISIWEGSFNSVFKWNKWVLSWQSLLWCHSSALGWENASLVWNNEVSWQHNVQKFSQKLHNCDVAIYTTMLTQLRTMI